MKFFNRKLIDAKLIGILVSTFLIIVLLSMVDIPKTIQAFSLMDTGYIVFILPIFLISFIIRALRWRILLNKPDLKVYSLLSSILIGFSLNCILPARAGELYRAYFFGKKENLKKTKVFTSVILERVFDGITLFLILCLAIYIFSPGVLFSQIACSAGALFLGCFTMLLIFAKVQESGNRREKVKIFLSGLLIFLPVSLQTGAQTQLNKVFSLLNIFLEELKMLNSHLSLFSTVFYSLIVWLAEGLTMLLVIKSFGIEISLLGALLVLSVTAFSTLIPAGPAGIGTYQWGYVVALGVFGVDKETGLAISITNQLLAIFLVLTAGAVFGWKEHINLAELRQKLIETPET